VIRLPLAGHRQLIPALDVDAVGLAATGFGATVAAVGGGADGLLTDELEVLGGVLEVDGLGAGAGLVTRGGLLTEAEVRLEPERPSRLIFWPT
jgi:hypothetical protein